MKLGSLKQAISASGGSAQLAKQLGISRQAIEQWRIVPARRVLDVARISGVARSKLRPDLYPPRKVAIQTPTGEAHP